MAGSRPEAKAKRDKKKTALLIVIGDVVMMMRDRVENAPG